MKEHPILFTGPMVRAILEGRKTQTRRIVKHRAYADQEDRPASHECPYGKPGDLLWVKEAWLFVGVDMNRHGRTHPVEDAVIRYKDGSERTFEIDWKLSDVWMNRKQQWRSGRFMPRWASRLLLHITDVRVQRVQEISAEDARAEGTPPLSLADGGVGEFHRLWDSLNAKRGHGWGANPWVWAITFIVSPSTARPSVGGNP